MRFPPSWNFISRERRTEPSLTKGQSRTRPFTLVNEAVNFEKQCIYVAVPKTGSTSIRVQLRQDGLPLIATPHLNICQIRDAIYIFELMRSLSRTNHFPSTGSATDADVRARAKNIFTSYFKFSTVRNPWARALSLYRRNEGIQVRNEMDFTAFCEVHLNASDTCHHPTLHRNQIDWHLDETGALAVDYVFKLEDFQTAILEIGERTENRLQLETLARNVNEGGNLTSYRSHYDEYTKSLIAKAFEKDIDYFKYSF